MERGSCEILPSDSLDLFKVLKDDTSRRFEVWRVERYRYRQETVCETNLHLGRRNTILAKYRYRFDLPQTEIKALEGLGGTGYDNVHRTINQAEVDMPILGQIRIRNINMVRGPGDRQVSYRRHGRWSTSTLSVPNRPGARRGPAGVLPRAPDGTGRLSVVRPGRPKCRTAGPTG